MTIFPKTFNPLTRIKRSKNILTQMGKCGNMFLAQGKEVYQNDFY